MHWNVRPSMNSKRLEAQSREVLLERFLGPIKRLLSTRALDLGQPLLKS